MEKKETNKTVVLGAGPCGLMAAWELAKNGREVIVVEQDDSVGGLCKTVTHGDFRFDLGGHRFITKNERLLGMIVDLMRDELLTAERRSVILLRGKQFEYPINIKNLSLNLDFFLFIRAVFDFLAISMKKEGKDEASFEGWIKNRYGKTLYNLFFGPYTEKLWGIKPSEISSDWAVQRISSLDLSDVIKNVLGLKKDKKRTFTKRFYYPKMGMGQIFERIKVEIEKKGGIFHFHSSPVHIDTEGSAVKSVSIIKSGKIVNIPCDFLISTIPLDGLSSLFVPAKDKKKFKGLPYRALRFLNIMVDKEEISPNTWMYVSEPQYFMTRIQEPKRRSPFSAPPSKTSVILEIPCNVGDDIFTCSDDLLLEKGFSDLKKIGINLGGSILGYFSTFAENAYPVYTLDYRSQVKKHLEIIQKYDNIITCGRQGLFRYVFMDTAMEMGLAAADCVMGMGDIEDIYKAGIDKSLLEVKSIV